MYKIYARETKTLRGLFLTAYETFHLFRSWNCDIALIRFTISLKDILLSGEIVFPRNLGC